MKYYLVTCKSSRIFNHVLKKYFVAFETWNFRLFATSNFTVILNYLDTSYLINFLWQLSEFCCSEKGELLTMRLKILCEDRCEDIAVNLAAACVRSLRRSDQLRLLSESHHVHYMIDVYIVLLYKLKRTQDIFAQVSGAAFRCKYRR